MRNLLINSIKQVELSLEERAQRESRKINDSLKAIGEAGFGSKSFDDEAVESLVKTFDDTYLPRELWQFYKRVGAISISLKGDKTVKFLDAKEIKDKYKEVKEKNKDKDFFASDTLMPITSDVWVDLSGAIGTEGAIYQINTNSDGTISSTNKVASNFEKWLSSIVHDIEPKKKEVSKEELAETEVSEDKDSFTYDDSENPGKKQIVQLTGPLSEIYTRALNIYYKKKPVFDSEVDLDGVDQDDREQINEIMNLSDDELGTESYKTNTTEIANYIQNNKLTSRAQENVTFVHTSIVPSFEENKNPDVTIVAWLLPSTDVDKPEVVNTVKTAAEDKNKQVLMVITDENRFFSKGMGITHVWKDLVENVEYIPGVTPKEQLLSFESLYSDSGVKVLVGYPQFAKYLNSL